MLKNISSLGKALNKAEQQSINGGASPLCPIDLQCTWRKHPITGCCISYQDDNAS